MASFLAAGMQAATWISAGMGEAQGTRWHIHGEAEAVADRWDGRCFMRARCVITEHLGDRRKKNVWSTEAAYLLVLLGSTAGVPEGRSAALIRAGEPV
jgi:hypothetical protein